ncbi:hypothetical protein [Spiroplasma kunkelii]|nr:hypothetical protein [Spiroplasma kunkelii]
MINYQVILNKIERSIVKKDITIKELWEMGMEHLLKNLGELDND